MNNLYKTETTAYTSGTNIIANCNAISFTNKGKDVITVNSFPVEIGDTYTIAGNLREVDQTEYKVYVNPNSDNLFFVVKKIDY